MFGTDDKGWIREIPRPGDCHNYKKVLHSSTFRLILTERGRLFVNGHGFDDVITLVEPGSPDEQVYDADGSSDEENKSDMSALRCFKEVNA